MNLETLSLSALALRCNIENVVGIDAEFPKFCIVGEYFGHEKCACVRAAALAADCWQHDSKWLQ